MWTDSFGKNKSFDTKSNSNLGDLEGFRKVLTAEAISERASRLSISGRTDSISSYESGHNWSSWCLEREVHPFRCSINFILDVLADSHDKRLVYRSINGYRSAISAYQDKIQEIPAGQSSIFSSLLAGVFKKRPPQSRYGI